MPRAKGGVAIFAGADVEVEAQQVFNFEVDVDHDYWVGTQGVLAHNAECGEAAEKIAGRLLDSFGGSVKASLEELSNMKLGQEKTLEVLEHMYKASGRGTGGTHALADGTKVLLSRRVGANQAVLLVDRNGAVKAGTATIEITGDPTSPLRAVNIQH